ncbi:MAG: acetyl-CoA carboxylase biotin carboxyl carrier protein [Candidatus Neomarinimicrobiota bacterium]
MWQDKLKEIIYILEHSDVNEIEVRHWGRRYRVVKNAAIVTGNVNPEIQNQGSAAVSETETAENKIEPAIEGDEVLSPMPGTFYRAASPTADPFVEEGGKISKGETLCIIEAMKIMNEIEAEINGTIVKIIPADASPIEYNQPLFIIKPA